MKSSGSYYPAKNGLDGNMNTQANTAYGGDNLTYWDVRLKRNFAITRVYAMVCMQRPTELREYCGKMHGLDGGFYFAFLLKFLSIKWSPPINMS